VVAQRAHAVDHACGFESNNRLVESDDHHTSTGLVVQQRANRSGSPSERQQVG
jgi:hypothetical protein